MKKVAVKISDDKIFFSFIYIDPTIINVTMEDNNENNYIFSDKYLKVNFKLFFSFINNILLAKKINTIVIEDTNLLPLIVSIINNMKRNTNLIIDDDKKINDDILKLLLKTKYLKELNCFDIEKNIAEKLAKNNIKFKTRKELLTLSNFSTVNSLDNYSDIYFKEDVKVINNFNNKDLVDFENFCKQNKNLKNVYFYGFPSNNAEKILDNLHFNYLNKIKISLYVDSNNINIFRKSINKIKKLKKKYKKNKNIKFEVVYSEEYFKKNYFKQLSLITLKVCCLVGIVFAISTISLMGYNNYMSKKSIKDIRLIATPKKIKLEEPIKEQPEVKEEEKVEEKPKVTLNENYDELLKINDETVGWLKVNNTNVNFPIVQTSNNDYYLDYNFYKKRNYNGWAFVDYRNNLNELDKNTIIYGHNGTIFGSLYNTLKNYWLNNENNYIISFNTRTNQMQFRIFAIYKTTPDFYYLDTNYSSNIEFMNFIDEVKKRSIHDFGTEVNENDHILTLSTCIEKGTQRVVIHAKRI